MGDITYGLGTVRPLRRGRVGIPLSPESYRGATGFGCCWNYSSSASISWPESYPDVVHENRSASLPTLKTPAKAYPAPTLRSVFLRSCLNSMADLNPLIRYVEEQYKLQIGNAQNTQLARAIATGAEKGIFVLPKGDLLSLLAARSLALTLSSKDHRGG